MGVALAELYLLDDKTEHSQVGYIGHGVWPFILIASLESLNYKHIKVLSQQR